MNTSCTQTPTAHKHTDTNRHTSKQLYTKLRVHQTSQLWLSQPKMTKKRINKNNISKYISIKQQIKRQRLCQQHSIRVTLVQQPTFPSPFPKWKQNNEEETFDPIYYGTINSQFHYCKKMRCIRCVPLQKQRQANARTHANADNIIKALKWKRWANKPTRTTTHKKRQTVNEAISGETINGEEDDDGSIAIAIILKIFDEVKEKGLLIMLITWMVGISVTNGLTSH